VLQETRLGVNRWLLHSSKSTLVGERLYFFFDANHCLNKPIGGNTRQAGATMVTLLADNWDVYSLNWTLALINCYQIETSRELKILSPRQSHLCRSLGLAASHGPTISSFHFCKPINHQLAPPIATAAVRRPKIQPPKADFQEPPLTVIATPPPAPITSANVKR
jgi:hypothetical protein